MRNRKPFLVSVLVGLTVVAFGGIALGMIRGQDDSVIVGVPASPPSSGPAPGLPGLPGSGTASVNELVFNLDPGSQLVIRSGLSDKTITKIDKEPANGEAKLNEAGDLIYRSDPGFVGKDVLEYQACTPEGECARYRAFINLGDAQAAPESGPDASGLGSAPPIDTEDAGPAKPADSSLSDSGKPAEEPPTGNLNIPGGLRGSLPPSGSSKPPGSFGGLGSSLTPSTPAAGGDSPTGPSDTGLSNEAPGDDSADAPVDDPVTDMPDSPRSETSPVGDLPADGDGPPAEDEGDTGSPEVPKDEAPVNSDPVAGEATVSTSKNANWVKACVLQRASDPDGDTLTISSVGTPSPLGSASIGDAINGEPNCNQTVLFEYPDGWTGIATIPFTVSDGKGGTDTANLVVTITNSAPDAVDDSIGAVDDLTGSASTLWTLPVLCNDSDPDGDTISIISATTTEGAVTVGSDSSKCKTSGNVLLWSTGGYLGSVTFTYTISDGEDTDTATVTFCAESPVNPVYCP